ncbi:MAG: rhomboid family intramembrane serine protease [Flavobacteriaceae bacterium]|nr:rhomboid family intramembrane serine protease [Flavobacteriaceae bacterium]
MISYGFLHDGFIHILFNLVMLYYFGTLFLDYFTEKQFLYYYFAGILFGGLVFLLSYNYLPVLKSTNSLLVGASAGVMSILAGLATLIPNYSLRFQFIGFVKLKYILFFVLILDLLQMPMGNAGGHLAHLGGAFIGFLTTLNFVNNGITVPKNRLKRPKANRKNLRTVHKNENPSRYVAQIKNEEQKKIDLILDKISKSGYDALSREEKQFLFDTGKK